MTMMTFLNKAKYEIILSCEIRNFTRAFYEENQHGKIVSTSENYNVTEAIVILLAACNE